MKPDENRLAFPAPDRFIHFPADSPPLLLVIVDAEEEFDWTSYRRTAVSVDNIARQILAQEVLDRFGVVPTYMVDYPVASQDQGIRPLAEFLADGRCRIGAQLHSWVTPPFDEEISPHTSFAGNLPQALESAKIKRLTTAIETSFGVRPTIYRAGRYGFGRNTAAALCTHGYNIDCSVLPWVNLQPRHGPDFSAFGPDPFWLDPERRLLELPLTAGMVGLMDRLGLAETVYPWTTSPVAARLRLPAVMSRLRLLDRIPLTPEGTTLAEAKRVTRWLAAAGHRLFSVSYHSSSLLVGGTPYVRDQADLTALLDWLQGYLDFFFDEMAGKAATPQDIRRQALDGPG
ncbi:MAG: polysaccharide deacetylase family protein [Alphaproteobacteria bacterium]|nr:polysaccharide deacetylase family protein [Alphaproteobacteria bacterium]